MSYQKRLYGTTIIDCSKLEEIEENGTIELEYYRTKSDMMLLEDSKPYGVEIIKRNVKNEMMNIEQKVVNHLFKQEKEISQLLELLMNNKVTPIALDDIITDMQSV